MATTGTPLPKHDPLMIEWEKFKARGEYANCVKWASYPRIEMSENGKGEVTPILRYDHGEGALWAAFCAGWNAHNVEDP